MAGTVSVLLGAATFEDNPEEGIAYVVDLTQRKKLEQQFLRAQRMESIGTLAGGIAHDLNNVLGPIMMSIAVLKMRFPDPASRELIAIIATSAERGADMVRQVLSFARGVEGRRMEMQVGHLLAEVEQIARDTFSKNILVRSFRPARSLDRPGRPDAAASGAAESLRECARCDAQWRPPHAHGGEPSDR